MTRLSGLANEDVEFLKDLSRRIVVRHYFLKRVREKEERKLKNKIKKLFLLERRHKQKAEAINIFELLLRRRKRRRKKVI